MAIIIGLGSGRSGTVSLARLLNSQEETVCFHEINPCCMSWSGSAGPVFSMLNEFQSILNNGPRDRVTIDLTSPNRNSPLKRLQDLSEVSCIGDVGFYYLNYVEQIIPEFTNVKFPCLRRNKTETIRSFINKMKINSTGIAKLKQLAFRLPKYRNHWVDHSGEKWLADAKWDKCYPTFEVDSLEQALSLYWHFYYSEAERLSKKYQQVRIFDVSQLNTSKGQKEILEFCGFSKYKVIKVHENRGM